MAPVAPVAMFRVLPLKSGSADAVAAADAATLGLAGAPTPARGAWQAAPIRARVASRAIGRTRMRIVIPSWLSLRGQDTRGPTASGASSRAARGGFSPVACDGGPRP